MEPMSFPGDRDSPLSPRSPGSPRGDDAGGHRPTEINALLGRGTHFEGKLFFEGRVRIDGSFRGEIRGEDVLVIGEGALVIGEIHVVTCIVTGGEVQASIRARDAIELYAPSKVTGALHAPAIFIDRGVQFDGSCKMAPLEEEPGERPLRPPGASSEPDVDAAAQAARTAEDSGSVAQRGATPKRSDIER
ncbi:bactofilin family protein [Sorangium sp. So ce388]|uniref:bactofilin family protein n=1 Tax=Sorangium sp. So ce388 TaxID=3133309 RepID=UPI000A7F903D